MDVARETAATHAATPPTNRIDIAPTLPGPLCGPDPNFVLMPSDRKAVPAARSAAKGAGNQPEGSRTTNKERDPMVGFGDGFGRPPGGPFQLWIIAGSRTTL